jgi:hypothetical protein
MSLRLNGSTSGYSEIEAPAVAGDQTFTLPGTGGTIVTADGTQTLTNKTVQGGVITAGTAVASTSGTAIDFTGIPSWVKRVTVMFDGVSTNGTSLLVIRLGTSSGIVSSGYLGAASSIGATVNTQNWLSGFGLRGSTTAAADVYHGKMICTLVSGNTWESSHIMALSNVANTLCGAGSISLADTLTQIRITTTGGTDTFDAGSINILMEG